MTKFELNLLKEFSDDGEELSIVVNVELKKGR